MTLQQKQMLKARANSAKAAATSVEKSTVIFICDSSQTRHDRNQKWQNVLGATAYGRESRDYVSDRPNRIVKTITGNDLQNSGKSATTVLRKTHPTRCYSAGQVDCDTQWYHCDGHHSSVSNVYFADEEKSRGS